MAIARGDNAGANEGSLTYAPFIGWEGISEPKG